MLEIKIPLRTKVVLAGISVMILVVSAVVLWNAFRLRTEIGEQTKHYVSDITVQLTKDIDNRLSRVVVELEAIGDTLSRNDFYRSDPDRLQEYLERKVQTFGFTSIVILKADGTAYQSHSSAEEFNSLPGCRLPLMATTAFRSWTSRVFCTLSRYGRTDGWSACWVVCAIKKICRR